MVHFFDAGRGIWGGFRNVPSHVQKATLHESPRFKYAGSEEKNESVQCCMARVVCAASSPRQNMSTFSLMDTVVGNIFSRGLLRQMRAMDKKSTSSRKRSSRPENIELP